MTPEVRLSQSMNDRIKEFRSDPEKMDVTTKFVNEIVEKAKSEALKRMRERDREKDSQRVPNRNFEGEARKVFQVTLSFPVDVRLRPQTDKKARIEFGNSELWGAEESEEDGIPERGVFFPGF